MLGHALISRSIENASSQHTSIFHARRVQVFLPTCALSCEAQSKLRPLSEAVPHTHAFRPARLPSAIRTSASIVNPKKLRDRPACLRVPFMIAIRGVSASRCLHSHSSPSMTIANMHLYFLRRRLVRRGHRVECRRNRGTQ